jgi:hypothetical protein
MLNKELVHPVFHMQSGNQLEVANISRDRRRMVGEHNAGDQHVCSSYAPQSLLDPQAIELLASSLIERNNSPPSKSSFALVKPELRPSKLRTVCGLSYEFDSRSQDFQSRNNRDCQIVTADGVDAPKYVSLASLEVIQCVGVQQIDHATSSFHSL